MSPVPAWLRAWIRSGDTGISSLTIAHALVGAMDLLDRADAPRDTSDVGRCVRLLDLAAANAEDWRGRLDEVAAACPNWTPLVPRWAEIEVAYRQDEAAQRAAQRAAWTRKDGKLRAYRNPHVKMPPSRCWWLVATLRTDGPYDPYACVKPHPFVAEVPHDR